MATVRPASQAYGSGDAYGDAVAVVPSDTATGDAAARICSGIYIGVTGDVAVVMAGGSGAAVVFKGAVAGSTLRLRAVRVAATLTTATNMVFLYGAP